MGDKYTVAIVARVLCMVFYRYRTTQRKGGGGYRGTQEMNGMGESRKQFQLTATSPHVYIRTNDSLLSG